MVALQWAGRAVGLEHQGRCPTALALWLCEEADDLCLIRATATPPITAAIAMARKFCTSGSFIATSSPITVQPAAQVPHQGSRPDGQRPRAWTKAHPLVRGGRTTSHAR